MLENKMSDLKMSFKLVNGILRPNYYDFHTRELGIKFFKQAMGLKFEHGTKKGIDLVLVSNRIVGAEGEGDAWDGNYWDSYKSNMFGFPERTTNIPHRKFHFWDLQGLSKKANQLIDAPNPGWNMNLYFRVNNQEDQLILISPDTIHNRDKTMFKEDGITRMSNIPEDWLCVKQEFSPTWNLQPNGIWVLNGPYCGPSAEEAIKIEIARKERIDELVRELTMKRLKELKLQNK